MTTRTFSAYAYIRCIWLRNTRVARDNKPRAKLVTRRRIIEWKSQSSGAFQTGSFENQTTTQSGSLQNQTALHPSKSTRPSHVRKRGIEALLADVKNLDCSTPKTRRQCDTETVAKLYSDVCKPRGDAKKGVSIRFQGKTAVHGQANEIQNDSILKRMLKTKSPVCDKIRECIGGYISRNITWELKKAVAIHVMTTAIYEHGIGI